MSSRDQQNNFTNRGRNGEWRRDENSSRHGSDENGPPSRADWPPNGRGGHLVSRRAGTPTLKEAAELITASGRKAADRYLEISRQTQWGPILKSVTQSALSGARKVCEAATNVSKNSDNAWAFLGFSGFISRDVAGAAGQSYSHTDLTEVIVSNGTRMQPVEPMDVSRSAGGDAASANTGENRASREGNFISALAVNDIRSGTVQESPVSSTYFSSIGSPIREAQGVTDLTAAGYSDLTESPPPPYDDVICRNQDLHEAARIFSGAALPQGYYSNSRLRRDTEFGPQTAEGGMRGHQQDPMASFYEPGLIRMNDERHYVDTRMERGSLRTGASLWNQVTSGSDHRFSRMSDQRQPLNHNRAVGVHGSSSSASSGSGSGNGQDIRRQRTRRSEDPQRPPSPPTSPVNESSQRRSSDITSPLEMWEPIEEQDIAGLIGLRNSCNDCYINSPLQCLAATKELTRYFLSNKYKRDFNPYMRQKRGTMAHAVSNEVANLFFGMWEPTLPGGMAATELKRILGVLNPVYREDWQEDAYEFLQFLLETLHEELDRNPPKPRVIEAQPQAEGATNDTAVSTTPIILKRGHERLPGAVDAATETSDHSEPPRAAKQSAGEARMEVEDQAARSMVTSYDRPALRFDTTVDSAFPEPVGEGPGEEIERAGLDTTPRSALVTQASSTPASTPTRVKETKDDKKLVSSLKPSRSSSASSSKSRVRISVLPEKKTTTEDVEEEIGAMEYWKRFYEKTNSIITDLFYGLIVLHDTCTVCKKTCQKYEPFSSLYLPIKQQEDPESIENCIGAYFAREEIPNFHCQSCNARSTAIRYMSLHRGPEILVLRLNRDFNRHNPGKVDTPIDLSSDIIDLSRFGKNPSSSKPDDQHKASLDYRLYAVCNHYGSIQTGHYTAHAKHRSPFTGHNSRRDKWFRFDDEKVYEQIPRAPPKMAIEPYEVYILFYQRIHDEFSDDQRRHAQAIWNAPQPVSSRALR